MEILSVTTHEAASVQRLGGDLTCEFTIFFNRETRMLCLAFHVKSQDALFFIYLTIARH